MPIYEYECDGCHSVFEVRQKVSDPAPKQHSCGSTKVRRILSATSFVLKGTGWYATDYGNRKGDSDAKAAPAKADAKAKGENAPTAGASDAQQGTKPAVTGAQAQTDAPPKAAAGAAAKTQSS